MNQLQIDYSKKMTTLQLQFLSTIAISFSTSKKNKDLIEEKFTMQKKWMYYLHNWKI